MTPEGNEEVVAPSKPSLLLITLSDFEHEHEIPLPKPLSGLSSVPV